MTEEINYQWQNEFMLRTIYPMRATKLRDFLVYFQEVDLWAAYQLKTDHELEAEARDFQVAQERKWQEAFRQYNLLRAYFLTSDPSAEIQNVFPIPEQTVLKRILATHADFARYFPKLKSLNSEGYFITQYITLWETNRKDVLTAIAQKQHALDIRRADWPQRRMFEENIQELREVGLKMADRELDMLYNFLTAFTKIKTRQAAFEKLKTDLTRQRQVVAPQYERAQANLRLQEQQLSSSADALRPLQNPVDVPTLEAYFLRTDVSADYLTDFPNPDSEAITRFNQVHKDLSFSLSGARSLAVKVNQVRIQITALESYLQKVNAVITGIEKRLFIGGPTWPLKAMKEQELNQLREVKLAMCNREMGLLTDLLHGYLNANLTPAGLAAQLSLKKRAYADLEAKVNQFRQQAAGFKKTLDELDQMLALPAQEQVDRLSSQQKITRQDIVRGKIEEYYSACLEKDEQQLLEDVVARFLADPARYPIWLQYMVIHFSGMRYQSAHGSWANPKDLLISLSLKDVAREINRLDDQAVETLCQEKINQYTTPPPPVTQPDGPASIPRPQLSQSSALAWQARIEEHLKGLGSDSPYRRRKALLDLIIDEKNFEVDPLSDEQVEDRLRALKDDLPTWMWNEIVRLTNLRLTEVNRADWENPTALELAERNAYQASSFRQLLNDWKQEFLTGWREEHGRSVRLIVTRAVCNEVAEHIQHLRGQMPGGGLTNKPLWYQRLERNPKWLNGPDRAYLVRATHQGVFKVGASILFLNFTHKTPSPWQIANPIKLKTGEGLVPDALFRDSGRWNYRKNSEGHVIRSGEITDKKGKTHRQEQTMRWLHEATIALVAETADGTTVLTFETALPSEPRSRSAIGVFKHTLNELLYRVDSSVFSGTLIGYVPEDDLPLENLKEMLDWNKILRRSVLTPAEQDQYWQKATKK